MSEFDVRDYEYLNETLDVVRKKLNECSGEVEKKLEELAEFNKYFWDSRNVMDKVEKITARYSAENQASATNVSISNMRKLRRALDSPYFGKIDFIVDDYDEELDDKEFYIGLTSVMDGSKFYVVDWRSPIASLFYNSKFGDVSYKSPGGEVKGVLKGKRQYKISKGKLERVVDSELHLDDDSLQEALSRASSDKMKNIVNTIQEEQNEIIRNVKDRSIVVQGGAGSGKTSVALHRLAYLLFQDKAAKSDNMLIFSPNEVFSEYISTVLPQLGEENVLQTTFSDFASSFIRVFDHVETFSEFVLRSYSSDENSKKEINKLKFSKEFKDALDEYIKKSSRCFSFKDDLRIHGSYVPKEWLNRKLKSYNEVSLKERLDILSKDVCDALKISYFSYGASIKTSLKNLVTPPMNSRKFYNDFLGSDEFVSLSGKKDKIYSNAFLEYPDMLGMLYTHLELFGYPENNMIRHLVIDEAQDYSPIQLEMIKKIFTGATFTVLGDVNQTINPYFRYDSLEDMASIFGKNTKYYELNKSYRSSPEITEYSNNILGLDKIETARTSGNVPVSVKEVSKDSLFRELVKDVITMKENGFERIAIITKSDKEAKAIFEGLKDSVDGLSVITDDGKRYNTNTAVVPATIAKGLEFDGVISYNDIDSPYSEDDKYLYYVACTRAQHDLVVYNEPSYVKSKKR